MSSSVSDEYKNTPTAQPIRMPRMNVIVVITSVKVLLPLIHSRNG